MITGKVIDPFGQVLPNANIIIKERPLTGAITNQFGNFTINANFFETLKISHVGYETKEVKITSNTPSLIMLWEDSDNILSEVIITPPIKPKKSFNWWWMVPIVAIVGAVALSKKEQPKKVKL